MRRMQINWRKLLPAFLILAGVASIALALGADLVGLGRQEGLGRTQIALVIVGGLVASVGCVLATPPGQRYLQALCGADSAPASPLLIAVWFGLVTGWGETLVWFIRKYWQGRIIYLPLDFLWMTPLANLLLFLLFGSVLTAAERRWPQAVSLRILVSIYTFLGALSLLLLFEKLHDGAAVLLAAGLAVQVGRVVARHTQGFHKLVRYSLGWPAVFGSRGKHHVTEAEAEPAGTTIPLSRRQFLLGAGSTVAGMALSVRGEQWLAERRALASIPRTSASLPNVLLIVMDTVRAQSLSLYGYHRRTAPNLERLARRGVVFEQAIAPAPWTLPTHASLFTGRWPCELSTRFIAPLDDTYPTLAEVLGAHGYRTAGFVANLILCSYEWRLDRGFAHYDDYSLSPGQLALSSSLSREIGTSDGLRNALNAHEILNRKTAAAVQQEFLRWLSRHRDQPFFAFLNYFDAHEPYLPPPPFDIRFGPRGLRRDHTHEIVSAVRSDKWKMSPEEVQVELDAYEGAIAYVDHQLGLLFAELERQELLEDTLFIITSDHGEEFGEHGVFDHGKSLYLPSLYVPLLISHPSRVPAARWVREAVTLRDVSATVLDLVGLGEEVEFPGRSLARHWGSSSWATSSTPDLLLSEVGQSTSEQAWYPAARGPMKSLVYGNMHYIVNEGDGQEELYDIEHDPWEMQDLAVLEQGRSSVDWFRASLEAFLEQLQG